MSQHLSFIIVSNDAGSYKELRDALTADGRPRLLSAGVGANLAEESVARLSPAAVIIELDSEPGQGLALVSRVAESSPRTVIICASRNSSPDLILRSLRAGAREFLRLPIIPDELNTVLDRTAEFNSVQRRGEAKKRGRAITVFSSKGGCGCSFIAANVAAALQAPAALVDLNLEAGDLDLYLGLEANFSIADLVQNRARLDDSLLKSYLTPHSTRLSLLASPHEAGAAEDIRPEHVLDVLELLRERFDYVVIDTQHCFDPNTLTALDNADDILLVLTLDIPAIRSAQRTLQTFDRLGYPRQKVHIVVNRMSKQVDLDVDQVERLLGERVLSVVQNDFKVVVNSVNLGRPLVESLPSSAPATDLARIASALKGVSPGGPDSRKGLLGSLFRRQAAAGKGALDLRVTPDKA